MLGFAHANLVTDSGERLVRGAAALLVVQGTVLGGIAVCYLPEQISVGLGDRLCHRYGTVGEDLQRCVLVEGHALACTQGRGSPPLNSRNLGLELAAADSVPRR